MSVLDCFAVQVITLAGELLDKANYLLKEGLTTVEVADGYDIASQKVRRFCPYKIMCCT